MISWGQETPWYLKVLSFLQNIPFNAQKNGAINLNIVLINAFFETFCVSVVAYLVLYYIDKKYNR
jgi:hypothetical protein